MVGIGVPQIDGLPVKGSSGTLAPTGASMQPASARSGQNDGFACEPLGKRSASWDFAAGKPQKVMSASVSGASWVIRETVNRRP